MSENIPEQDRTARQIQDSAVQSIMQGRSLTRKIAAVNTVLAILSVIVTPDFTVLSARLLMCLALFLAAPRIKLFFSLCSAVCVLMISTVWLYSDESAALAVAMSIADTACLIVSSMILLIDRNIAEYLEAKYNRR